MTSDRLVKCLGFRQGREGVMALECCDPGSALSRRCRPTDRFQATNGGSRVFCVLLFCQKVQLSHFASAIWSRMMCVIEDSWRDRLGWSSAQKLASMISKETAILQEPNA